jgi:hypothetical protein
MDNHSNGVSRSQINVTKIIKDIDVNKIIIYKSKIGFVSGSKDNPLNNVYYYNKINPTVCSNESSKHISFLVPNVY